MLTQSGTLFSISCFYLQQSFPPPFFAVLLSAASIISGLLWAGSKCSFFWRNGRNIRRRRARRHNAYVIPLLSSPHAGTLSSHLVTGRVSAAQQDIWAGESTVAWLILQRMVIIVLFIISHCCSSLAVPNWWIKLYQRYACVGRKDSIYNVKC